MWRVDLRCKICCTFLVKRRKVKKVHKIKCQLNHRLRGVNYDIVEGPQWQKYRKPWVTPCRRQDDNAILELRHTVMWRHITQRFTHSHGTCAFNQLLSHCPLLLNFRVSRKYEYCRWCACAGCIWWITVYSHTLSYLSDFRLKRVSPTIFKLHITKIYDFMNAL